MTTASEGDEKVRESLCAKGYSETVIDQWLQPRNMGLMKYYDAKANVTSSCGDSMWMWLRIRNRVIWKASFVSDICIGAVTSGSALTEMVKDKPVSWALSLSGEAVYVYRYLIVGVNLVLIIVALTLLPAAVNTFRPRFCCRIPWETEREPRVSAN